MCCCLSGVVLEMPFYKECEGVSLCFVLFKKKKAKSCLLVL